MPVAGLSGWFNPANWGRMKLRARGVLRTVGRVHAGFVVHGDQREDRSRNWTPISGWLARSALSSGLISGAGLAAVLSWLRGPGVDSRMGSERS